jgi:hypothetical protein
MSGTDTTWWGPALIPAGTCGRWRIGPTTIWIERLRGEWRVATESSNNSGDGVDDEVEVENPADAPELLEMDNVARYGMSTATSEITLSPLLADRPVVTRPLKPFVVPARETVTVFVGSPVWLALHLGDSNLPFDELPIDRPADTWFGPPTAAGQLCYASRTACRLRRAEMPIRPHRALSKVRVVNRADSAFLLERMQLPVEYLELYRSADGALLTQDVELERAEANAPAPMTVLPGAPSHAKDAVRVAAARKRDSTNLLVGAFTALFR